jgi:multicomponent Na+:H+ antiporter subunit G
MDLLLEVFSWFFLMTGSAFVLIGAIGVLRLPEVFTRSHAAGMIDTMGAGLILLGLMFQAGGFNLVLVKLIMIGFFLFFTSPVSSHALVRAAMADGAKPLLKDGVTLKGNIKDKGDKPS